MNALVVSDEPLKLVLINTIGVGTAELVDDGIQARFGGVGLPTTIKDANESITDLSNLVAVQVHSCLLYTSPSPRDVEESRMPSSA